MRLLLLVLLVLFSSSSFSSSAVKIATDPWCPYVCVSEKGSSGILVEIVEQSFAENGYLVDFIWLNWARAIAEARKGRIQGIIGAFKTDSPDYIFGKEHLLESEMCFFTSQGDNWAFQNMDSLSSRVTVVVKSYSYGSELDSYVAQNENSGSRNVTSVYGMESITKRLKLLEKRKIDTLVEDKLVMAKINQNLKPEAKLRQAGCLPPEKVYLAFSPNSNLSPRLSRAFDKGVKSLKRSGRLKQIINEYK